MKDVDAVHIATPDHWHASIAVLACEAGKDVYVEKPTSLTVREGRAMVNAARKHDRIVQVGTQHRSAPHFMKIAEMIQGGDIGPVRFVRVWNYANQWPNGIGRKPAGTAAGARLGHVSGALAEGSVQSETGFSAPSGISGIIPAATSPISAITASTPCKRSWASLRPTRSLLPVGTSCPD